MPKIESDPWDKEPTFMAIEREKSARVEEAYENLRLIRDTMERSTKHSSLSGFSGIVVGLLAIIGVVVSHLLIKPYVSNYPAYVGFLALTWTLILFFSIITDMLITKRRAARVGKHVFSKLGAHMAGAAAPGFTVGLVLTLYFVSHGQIDTIWPYWMLCFGMAICAVGQFSVRPVRGLGWAFVIAGALTLILPHSLGLFMIGVAFGGFNIIYGFYTGITRRDW